MNREVLNSDAVTIASLRRLVYVALKEAVDLLIKDSGVEDLESGDELNSPNTEGCAYSNEHTNGKCESQSDYYTPKYTPETSYRLPILQVLLDSGGQCDTKIVKPLLFDKMRTILNVTDVTELRPHGPERWEIRWWHTAREARHVLIENGYMVGYTRPNKKKGRQKSGVWGQWELTDKGRRAVERGRL